LTPATSRLRAYTGLAINVLAGTGGRLAVVPAQTSKSTVIMPSTAGRNSAATEAITRLTVSDIARYSAKSYRWWRSSPSSITSPTIIGKPGGRLARAGTGGGRLGYVIAPAATIASAVQLVLVGVVIALTVAACTLPSNRAVLLVTRRPEPRRTPRLRHRLAVLLPFPAERTLTASGHRPTGLAGTNACPKMIQVFQRRHFLPIAAEDKINWTGRDVAIVDCEPSPKQSVGAL
jgi:hypothetical protein